MTNCVLYARFSPRPDAAECDSILQQESRCAAYAVAKTYHINGAYRDENVSGGILVRPGLQKALAALKSGYVLVVDRSDRLSRSIAVGLAIREQIKEQGCTIEYVDGTPSGDSPEDTLFQNIMDSFATFERDRICFNTKRAMGKKKENCERVGQIPIGWRLDAGDIEGKRLVKHQEEWEDIKSICQKRSAGYSFKKIREDLDMYGQAKRVWREKTMRRLWKKHRFWACPAKGDPFLEPTHPI